MPSRRALLTGAAGLAGVVVADLTFRGRPGRPLPPPAAPTLSAVTDPAWNAASVDERLLVAAYEVALAAHPSLAAVLADPLAHHRAHLAAFTGSPAPAPPTAPASPGADSPADRIAVLSDLLRQERTAGDARLDAVAADVRGGGVLASVAAAEHVHADLLAAAITALGGTPPLAPTATTPAPSTSTTPTTPTTSTTSTRPTVRRSATPTRRGTARTSAAASTTGPTATPTP